MTSMLSLVVLVVVAFAGALFFQKLKIKNLGFKTVAYTGILYVGAGYVISPQVLDVVNESILGNLNVLFALVLGWVGFLIGLQANWSGLKRFPSAYYRFSTINFFLSFLLITTALFGVSTYLFPFYLNLQEDLVLALAGSVTSPIMLAVVVRDNRVQARTAHLLQFHAAFDSLLAISVIALLLVLSGIISPAATNFFWIHQAIIVSAALLLAYIYKKLAKNRLTDEENFLYLIAMILFIVGLTLYLGSSILFSTMVFGLALANITRKRRKLYHNIQQAEKPMYILLLIYAGVNMNMSASPWHLLIFFIIHTAAKILADYPSRITLEKKERHNGLMGLANIGMGGLALAIVLDYYIYSSYNGGADLLQIIVFSLLLSDAWVLRYLQKRIVA